MHMSGLLIMQYRIPPQKVRWSCSTVTRHEDYAVSLRCEHCNILTICRQPLIQTRAPNMTRRQVDNVAPIRIILIPQSALWCILRRHLAPMSWTCIIFARAKIIQRRIQTRISRTEQQRRRLGRDTWIDMRLLHCLVRLFPRFAKFDIFRLSQLIMHL